MRRTKNKKRRTTRYAQYYEKKMEPIWAERWETYLKRVRILKKNILALGPIPTKEVQLISTINYFVKFIDLLTDFHDKGILKCAPVKKQEAVASFDYVIVKFVSREESTSCYLNKSDIGKRVTINNLYFGVFIPITDEEDLNSIQTKVIDGRKVKVEVDFTPISEWINRRVVTIDGHQTNISQKNLANFLKEMRAIVLETIDSVLKE